MSSQADFDIVANFLTSAGITVSESSYRPDSDSDHCEIYIDTADVRQTVGVFMNDAGECEVQTYKDCIEIQDGAPFVLLELPGILAAVIERLKVIDPAYDARNRGQANISREQGPLVYGITITMITGSGDIISRVFKSEAGRDAFLVAAGHELLADHDETLDEDFTDVWEQIYEHGGIAEFNIFETRVSD